MNNNTFGKARVRRLLTLHRTALTIVRQEKLCAPCRLAGPLSKTNHTPKSSDATVTRFEDRHEYQFRGDFRHLDEQNRRSIYGEMRRSHDYLNPEVLASHR
jgi:hypothetical protein